MARKWVKLLVPAVFILCGLFLWWYNTSPSISIVSVSPGIANIDEIVTVQLAAKGAQRVVAESNLANPCLCATLDRSGEYECTLLIEETETANIDVQITAFRGWWGSSVELVSIQVNRPPMVRSAVVEIESTETVETSIHIKDPDGDECFTSVRTEPLYGDISIDGASVIYTPRVEYAGYDNCVLCVHDGQGGRSEGNLVWISPPTVFDSNSSLPEILLAPSIDIYGSSVNLYEYLNEADLRVTHSVITGHAEQLTCEQASAAASSAWLLLAEAGQRNLLTAGFGDLRQADSKEGQSNEDVTAARQPLLDLEQSFEFLGSVTGLALVKEVGFESHHAEVNDQIKDLATCHRGDARIAVRLQLPEPSFWFSSSEFPVVAPFFLLGSPEGNYLELTIGHESLLGEAFEALRGAHLAELKAAMLSEKIRLRDTYRQWAREDQEELERLKLKNLQTALPGEINLSPTCVQTPSISLWMEENGYFARWTYDYETGRTVPIDPPIWTSYAERLCQLPPTIDFTLQLAEQIDNVLQEIQELLQSGLLQTLNDSILLDCFLRGWELPFETDSLRALYDKWLLERPTVWAEMYEQMNDRGIAVDPLRHGNVLYWTSMEDSVVKIVPYFVLDASDGAIVLDSNSGIVEYFNWWEGRTTEPAVASPDHLPQESITALSQARIAESEGDPKTALQYTLDARWSVAKPVFKQALAEIDSEGPATAAEYLQEALVISPIRAAQHLLELWWSTYQLDTGRQLYETAMNREKSADNIGLAIQAARWIEGSRSSSRAELLPAALKYLNNPDGIAAYIESSELEIELIDAIASSGAASEDILNHVTDLEEKFGDYIGDRAAYLATALARSQEKLIEQIEVVSQEHNLQGCLGDSTQENVSIDETTIGLLAEVANDALREALYDFLMASRKLHRVYASAATKESISSLLRLLNKDNTSFPVLPSKEIKQRQYIECLMRGGNQLDCYKQYMMSDSPQTKNECADLRQSIGEAISDMKSQAKRDRGLENWSKQRDCYNSLFRAANEALPLDMVVWKDLVAPELFTKAIATENDEKSRAFALQALELAEEAYLNGRRLGVLQPMATWIEIAWRGGMYHTVLNELLRSDRPLQLLSPNLYYEQLGTTIETAEYIRAKEQGTNLVCIAMPADIPILEIAGFENDLDREALQSQLDGLSIDRLVMTHDGDLVSRLLATSFSQLSAANQLSAVFPRIEKLFLKCLAYGWYISDELIPVPPDSELLFASSEVLKHYAWAGSILDESHYLPDMIRIESADELAQIPKRVETDITSIHSKLASEGGLQATLRSQSEAEYLYSLADLLLELPSAISKGLISELQAKFPFLQAAGILRSGEFIAFCESKGKRYGLISSADGIPSAPAKRAIAILRSEASELALLSPSETSEWLLDQLGAKAKYSAWESVEHSAMTIKLGDYFLVSGYEGLLPLSENTQLILKQDPEKLNREQWQTLVDDFFNPLLNRVEYQVSWTENRPNIQLDLEDAEYMLLDVPVDPYLRRLLWMSLKGNPIAWVAESSDSMRAQEAIMQGVLNFDAPLTIVVSCPTSDYESPDIRKQWKQRLDDLRARIAELGLPFMVEDLSELRDDEGISKVQDLLHQGHAQVLGFLHVAEQNAFQVGQGGLLDIEKIRAAGPSITKDSFKAILGCGPLFRGLNDVFVESKLTPMTLTVGEELSAEQILETLSTLVERWAEERSKGKKEEPVKNMLPDFDLMGERNMITDLG